MIEFDYIWSDFDEKVDFFYSKLKMSSGLMFLKRFFKLLVLVVFWVNLSKTHILRYLRGIGILSILGCLPF